MQDIHPLAPIFPEPFTFYLFFFTFPPPILPFFPPPSNFLDYPAGLILPTTVSISPNGSSSFSRMSQCVLVGASKPPPVSVLAPFFFYFAALTFPLPIPYWHKAPCFYHFFSPPTNHAFVNLTLSSSVPLGLLLS